jgi:hypothetical protein
MYLIVLFALLAILALIIIVWTAYYVSAAYQQTLTITIPFEETYRYVPNLNKNHKFKLESIKITVTGSIKKDSLSGSTIAPGKRIKDLVRENIINSYSNCLLIHEANTFIVEENILKRCPIVKSPTLENLSIMFFNKLAPIMPKIGCQLVSVHLISDGTKVTHCRYKISD